jgi:hypothetical protein
MGFDAVSVSLSLDCITVTARRRGECVTAKREVGPPAINAWRIDELEKLAKGWAQKERHAKSPSSWQKPSPPHRYIPRHKSLWGLPWRAGPLRLSMEPSPRK